jgi:uncharacterized membrane protein YeaQ/YmgE (transglycosylase-associated protein family)
MVIIDLITALMGVGMGFLAFLVVGGITGVCAWAFYPGAQSRQKSPQKLLTAAFMGFLTAFGASYLGQYTNFFQSGQMLEWFIVVIACSLLGGLYAALSK